MTTRLSPFDQPPHGAGLLHTLRNANDMVLTISERGAAMVSWWAPDRYGRLADVLLGYRDALGYADNQAYFGAVIGRWANRIAGGRFAVGGALLQADVNDRGQHLHGGVDGFHRARWQAETEDGGLTLRLASPDGEGGFPGNLEVQVHYRLADDGSLSVDYEAVADAPTPVNLTVHPYFNLNGGSADVGDHMLQIDADYYLATDVAGIPVGRVPVGGTPFDFRQPAAIGPRLAWPDPQLGLGGGFDHCYCIHQEGGKGRPGPLREVARVYDPGSGRQLQVATTEVGLQLYTGNKLGGVAGRGAGPYARHAGFCLEAHAFPDQLNGPHAAAVILLPGQVYRQSTIYRLGLQRQCA
ncbi:MAG: galactose mutarotase [Pseudomonadota bacterium]|nr:galactose mutarotase [Pseudomonadota bacterium]